MPEPFIEHPTGDFRNALDAMTDAIARLRSLPNTDAWLTFCAQGMGDRPDSYAFSEVRLLGDRLDVGDSPLDTEAVCRASALPADTLTPAGPHYLVASLTPRQTAQLLDAIFRQHGHLKPFPDEGDDYAVGAEW